MSHQYKPTTISCTPCIFD